MQCPKCRSEVGNQKICPYCGATVYIQESFPTESYPSLRKNGNPGTNMQTDALQRIERLETKLNLILVLSVAAFLLSVLSLVVLAIK